MYFMRWSSLFVTSVEAVLSQFVVLEHTCWWGTIVDVVISNLFRDISLLREKVFIGGKNLRVARLTRSGRPGFSPQHLTVKCSCRFYDSTARKSKDNLFSFIKIKAYIRKAHILSWHYVWWKPNTAHLVINIFAKCQAQGWRDDAVSQSTLHWKRFELFWIINQSWLDCLITRITCKVCTTELNRFFFGSWYDWWYLSKLNWTEVSSKVLNFANSGPWSHWVNHKLFLSPKCF